MSDERKQEMMGEIFAEELEDRGVFLKGPLIMKAFQATIDRIAKLPQPEQRWFEWAAGDDISITHKWVCFGSGAIATASFCLNGSQDISGELVWDIEEMKPSEWKPIPTEPETVRKWREAHEPKPEPPKGREERVEEIRKMLCDAAGKSPRGVFYYQGMAEQIVATEPQAMSRDEIVEVVADRFARDEWAEDFVASVREGSADDMTGSGVLTAIDALVGKIPASNESSMEERSWKAYQTGDSVPLQEVIDDLKEAVRFSVEREVQAAGRRKTTKLKWHTPAEGPDRLDRICELLGKIPCGGGQAAYMQIFADGTGQFSSDRKLIDWIILNDDPEQVIAEYVAGLAEEKLKATE